MYTLITLTYSRNHLDVDLRKASKVKKKEINRIKDEVEEILKTVSFKIIICEIPTFSVLIIAQQKCAKIIKKS